MRMHNRTMRNKFVYGVDKGDTPLNEVWYVDKKGEARQIYPSNELLAASVQLELTRGSYTWAYVAHALEAIALQGSRSCCAQLVFGDGLYTFWVNKAHSALFMATLTEGGLVTFGANEGVPMQDVKPGTTVTLKLWVPSRKAARWDAGEGLGQYGSNNNSPTWRVPFLSGTQLHFTCIKGMKRVCPYYSAIVYGVGSGKSMGSGWHLHAGHYRGYSQSYVKPTPYPGFVTGDTGYRMTTTWSGGCWNLTVQPIYPAFSKTFTLKIKAAVAQQN